MKKLFFIFLATFSTFSCFAQYDKDTIEIRQKLGKVYYQNDEILTAATLYYILNANDSAALEVKQAKANVFPMYLFACTGGFLIGWPIGTAIGGGDPNWTLAIIGAGCVLLSIPFQVGYNKHILQAVTIYNKDLQEIGIKKPILELGMARNGFGVAVRF
jgi:hypothetical protein